MICPRCSVSEISPITGKCDLCGYSVVAAVAVEPADAIGELATRQLAHEFAFGEVIGRGKDTIVHRAKELSSGRAVIVKVILRRNAEPDTAESFRGLMATLAGFDHPHLIPVLRHGSTDSLFWFATEDRGAVPLSQQLRTDGPMDAKALRRMLSQLASALDYMHRHGIVHGAVKPENVLVDRDGWVRLADPNFVRPRWRRATRPTPVVNTAVTPPPGTPIVHEPAGPWVAPEERSRGERLPAADQYALGVLSVECLSGQEAESVVDPIALLGDDVPPRMRRALERALDEVPTRRYPGVSEFRWALEEDAAAVGTSTPVRRATSDVVMVKDWEPLPDARRPMRIVGRVMVGLLVLTAVAFATPQVRAFLWPPPPPTMQATASPAPGPVTLPPASPSSTAIAAPRPVGETPAAADPSRDSVRDRATPPSSIARPRAATPASTAPATRTPTNTAPTAAASEGATARLFVNATPWGQLSVDGTLVGNTPRANIPLTAGSHTLRVTRAGYVTWERSVRVAPGDTLRITDIVLTPERP